MGMSSVTEPVPEQLVRDPRWAAVKKVADSPQFARATRLREFLLYIACHELSGQTEEITEQKIGHRVYKRNELYSPADDNIVRVSAQQLRLKLREFYETEGQAEPWLIEIPKGKYIPQFRSRHAVETEKVEAEKVETEKPAAEPTRGDPRIRILAAAVLILAAIAAWPYIVHLTSVHLTSPHPATPPSNLFTSVFQHSTAPVQIVMSDEALVLMQSMLGHRFTLEEYTNQSYRNLPPAFRHNPEAEHIWNVLASRQIVNVGDTGVSTRIRDSLIQHGAGPAVETRSAQNMRPRDFLSGNFILLGESSSNPWVEMFGESRFNFQFSPDILHFPRPIVNLHPRPGEQTYYVADLARNLSYARVVYVPNVTDTGHALLIAGTSMEGTEAAAEFCLEPESVSKILRGLGLRAGEKIPPFEVLLLTSSKGGAGIGAELVASRIMQGNSP
jgi:hypothetical protein